MTFFIRLNTRAFVARRSRVRITPARWDDLIAELARRGQGERESGAFLLAPTSGPGTSTVADVAYFDDLDPTCLNGAILLQSSAFTLLWDLCAQKNMRVIADVHTHPTAHVRQSDIDRENPMIASAGHVAIIVPTFASGSIRAENCGVHIYRGSRQWDVIEGPPSRRELYIGRWA